jgi:hypothetical protein
MKYKEISNFKPSHFKRLVGVPRTIFDLMVEHLLESKLKERKHPTRGVHPKLCIEDELLMMLMYYREYRTFFHVGASYGISETQCWRIVTRIESTLLKSKLFHLPGKKSLLNTTNAFEIVIVDVSEHPVERPKKNSETIIQAKRKDIQSKAK